MAEYEGIAIYPWHFAIALVFSFITLAFGLSIRFLMEKYTPLLPLRHSLSWFLASLCLSGLILCSEKSLWMKVE